MMDASLHRQMPSKHPRKLPTRKRDGRHDFAAMAAAYLKDTVKAQESINTAPVVGALQLVLEARRQGCSVYIAGNGGSASTASHMATDLAKTSAAVHGKPVRAIALTDNIARITATGNDVDFDHVFSDQVTGLAQPGDVVVLISASGNSPNILRAAEAARSAGAKVIALTGFGGGKLAPLADVNILVDSRDYGPVEDAHLAVNHMLTRILRAVE